MADTSITLEEYLRGLVRTSVSDEALKSICVRMGIDSGSTYSALSDRQIDLCTAWLYVWLSSSPSTSSRVEDKDGEWSHSEGGESMSASVLREYLRMANYLFSKWGEPTINASRWGMIVNGLHDIRDYGGRRRITKRNRR